MAAMLNLTCKLRPALTMIERNFGIFSTVNIDLGGSSVNGNLNSAMKFSTTTPVLKEQSTLFEQAREFSKQTDLARKPEHHLSESDSESDRENAGFEKGNSLFWRRKMRTLHNLLDINKDGVISYDDFMLLAEKFGDLGNLSEKSLQKFRDAMRTTWEHQWGEVSPYNLVTVEQYLTYMQHALNEKDKVSKKTAICFLPYLFKAVDKDRSGFISLREFKIFYRCLGLTEEDAAVAFHIIDSNGDGKLTQKEFEKLGKDYFLTEDERRVSRMFWGPLIDH